LKFLFPALPRYAAFVPGVELVLEAGTTVGVAEVSPSSASLAVGASTMLRAV
jgi:hypothetical protein